MGGRPRVPIVAIVVGFFASLLSLSPHSSGDKLKRRPAPLVGRGRSPCRENWCRHRRVRVDIVLRSSLILLVADVRNEVNVLEN